MKLQSCQVKILLFMCSFLYNLNSLMCHAEETLMEKEINSSFLRVYNFNPFDVDENETTASTGKEASSTTALTSTSLTEIGTSLITGSTESSPATTVVSSTSTTETSSTSTTGDTESATSSTTIEITESTTDVETETTFESTTTTTTTTTRVPTTTASSTTPEITLSSTTPTTTTTTTPKTTTKTQSSIPNDDEPSAFNIAPLIVLPIVTIILLIGIGYYMMNHVRNQYVSYDRGCLFEINRCCTSTASEFSILDELSLSEVTNSRKSSLGSNYTI